MKSVFYVQLIFVFSLFMGLNVVAGTLDDCERIISSAGNSYAPTRTSLVVSKSVEDDSPSAQWTLGNIIMGEVFDLQVVGFDRIFVNDNNQLIGIRGNASTIIGSVSKEESVDSGDMAYPVSNRKVQLNDSITIKFELVEQKGIRFWRATIGQA